MKKLFLTTAVLAMIGGYAHADGYDLTHKSITELTEDTSAPASGDYTVRYDDSTREFKKVDATDLDGQYGITASAAELNQAADISANSEIVTEANTITTAECGETFFLNDTTEFASTLPSPAQGCKFKFIVTGAPSGADYTVVTTGAETIKGIGFESETDTGDDGPTTAAADTVTFVDGVAAAGDQLWLESDGTSWLGISFTSSDGGVTFSSAI